MNTYQQRYPREQLEEWLTYLVGKYPGCFYRDPALKLPLKKDIQADLQTETAINVEAAVSFYTRDWYYLGVLQAGAERVDLYGKKAGVVTEQEAKAAARQIADERQKLKEKRAAEQRDATATLNAPHANGRISTDRLSKLDAPRVTAPVPEVKRPTDNPLARLQSLLARTVQLLTAEEDRALQSALVAASLKVLIQEAQKVITNLEAS
jgi:sRNA-binding protein